MEYTEECLGKCPNCGSENLNYETCVNDGEQLYYPFFCDDCDCTGKEIYNVDYAITVWDD